MKPAFVSMVIMTRFEVAILRSAWLSTQTARGGESPPDRGSAFSLEQRPVWMRDGMEVQLCEGGKTSQWGRSQLPNNPGASLGVVAHRMIVCARGIRGHGGRGWQSIRRSAMSVWVQGLKVGYVSRDGAVLPQWPSRQQAHHSPRMHSTIVSHRASL